MRLTDWDGLGPLTALAALVLLAFLPGQPAAISLDHPRIREAGALALESGKAGSPVAWTDAGSGLSGTITPLPVFRSAAGAWCRGFRLAVRSSQGLRTMEGIACRDSSGHWQETAAAPGPASAATQVAARL